VSARRHDKLEARAKTSRVQLDLSGDPSRCVGRALEIISIGIPSSSHVSAVCRNFGG
jgi:hypothetical protein